MRNRTVPRDARYRFGAPQRDYAGRKPALQLWHAGTGGLPQGLRVMKQAEKFHRPIITFIDTRPRVPIARNLMEMSGLTVPVLAIVTGEGPAAAHWGWALPTTF